ncbi:MAG: T9SS type A sorting domain-containing protein [Bacteroidetes bacterium]|nr:T9SS type A sorting domain-containing protein [Bacteroidota bacterium]
MNQSTTTIKENDIKNSFIIYPNPTSDQFFIVANTTDKLVVDMYDVNGRHVFSKSVSDKSNIDVTTLIEGIYNLTIKTVDRVINKKLVILR